MNLFYFGNIGVANDREDTVICDTANSESYFKMPMTIGYFYEVKRKLEHNCKLLQGGTDKRLSVVDIFKEADMKLTTELESELRELFTNGVFIYSEESCLLVLYYNYDKDAFELWAFDLELNSYKLFAINNYKSIMNEMKVVSRER